MSKKPIETTLKTNENEDSGEEEETSSVGSCSTNDNASRSETPTSLACKGRRGRKGKRRKTPPITNISYKYSCHAREDHGAELFGVQFNRFVTEPDIFAVVGTSRVSIYQCLEDGGIKIILAFQDSNPGEVYYSCAWTVSEDKCPLICVAGKAGVIRVINIKTETCVRQFIGHGNAINEIKIHPRDPSLILSVSRDHTLRLWNLKTAVCIAIFGSVEGHRDEVLSADFNLDGNKIMSCGMDHYLKLWRLDHPEMQTAIKESYKYNDRFAKRPFKTCEMHFPDFSTRDIHKNYVDCVRWFGEIVLSKSCDNCIVAWKPGRVEDKELRKNETNVSLIHRFDYKDCDIWFMRFCMDLSQKVLALGNQVGKIYVWDLDVPDAALSRHNVLSHPKCMRAIRQTSFSNDGTILIAVCDDSTIWRWDRVLPVKQEADC